jgi:hypothetical protein
MTYIHKVFPIAVPEVYFDPLPSFAPYGYRVYNGDGEEQVTQISSPSLPGKVPMDYDSAYAYALATITQLETRDAEKAAAQAVSSQTTDPAQEEFVGTTTTPSTPA